MLTVRMERVEANYTYTYHNDNGFASFFINRYGGQEVSHLYTPIDEHEDQRQAAIQHWLETADASLIEAWTDECFEKGEFNWKPVDEAFQEWANLLM